MSSRKKSQLQEKVRISRNFDFIADSALSIFLRVRIPLCSASDCCDMSWKLASRWKSKTGEWACWYTL